jgi:recombination associated protein RdgC
MFFRNLTLFRMFPDVCADLARLPEVAAHHRLRQVGPLEVGTIGFVPPVGRIHDEAELIRNMPGEGILTFAIGAEEKLLPAAVVNDELQHRVQKIAEEEGRKPGRRERQRIKEDILTEFLRRAFVRSARVTGYADTTAGWLVLDTASRKTAENVLTRIREALGSFPALPLAPEESPRVIMTDWLASGLPEGFELGDECELRDPSDARGAVVVVRRDDINSDEVHAHLASGKIISKMALIYKGRVSFVLGEDLTVRKLNFLDVVHDELVSDLGEADALAHADGTLAIQAKELGGLLADFTDIFGLHLDAPLRLHREHAHKAMRDAAHAAPS